MTTNNFKERITKELEQITESRESNIKDLRELKLNQADPLDKTEADDNIRRINTRLERLDIRSKALKTALIRIKEETYGYCEGCGYEIQERRLMAVPEACRCPDCEEAFFKRIQNQYGTSTALAM